MAASYNLKCDACGLTYEASQEYLLENAGCQMECNCGQMIDVPEPESDDVLEEPQQTPALVLGAWRSGSQMVLAPGTRLPDRCCICNEELEEPARAQTLKWAPHNDGTLLTQSHFGLLAKLIGNAISDSYSRAIVVHIGFCHRHRRARLIRFAWMVLLAGGSVGVAQACNHLTGFLVGIVLTAAAALMLAAALIFWTFPGVIRVVGFTGSMARIDGFGASYLASLPPYRSLKRMQGQQGAEALEQLIIDDDPREDQ
jgi:hypothetical protein